MATISGTTIEYETKKHGEITSAYTYSPFFAAWNSYLLHDSSANTLCRWASPNQTIRLQKSESVAYVDVLWIVNDPLDPRLSFYTKLVTDDTDDTLQVITKLDIQKYKLVIDGYYYKTATESGTGTSETYKAAGEELPANSFITRYITHWEAKNNPTDRTADTTPVIRYYDGTRYWYWKVPDMFNPQLCNDPRNNELFGDYLVSPYDNDLDVGYLRAPITAQNTWTYPPLRNSMLVGTSDDFAMIFDNPTEQRNVVSVNLTNIDAMLRSIACLGVYFEYDGVMYLGFMDETGQTTGEYLTADKWNTSAQYQSNNINNYSSHTPPYVPPVPPVSPGIWDDMPGAGSSIGALAGARCYICSKTDITNLKTWMSKTEADGGPPDGYDVLSSLISVMAFPIDMTPASSGPATAISFTGLKTSTDNQLANIAAALLSIANQIGATPKTEIKTFTSTATAFPSAGNPFTIDLGTCDCPTFYSSDFPFVDYDASVELYIPFIGCMTLDTQTVMGKSLHAYMSVDPITGAIYAWCECTKDGSRVVVASGSGAFGVNTPITANQVGMAMAQIKNNAAQQRQTAIQSALTLGIGAFAGMDKNISSILSRNMATAIGQRSANIAIATGRDYMDALSVGASQAAMTAIPNAIGANLNTGRANRQIAQANHNSITGSAGGSTADWSCSYTPYLKVITPDVHRAGEQYEHTYGIPTIQSGTLSTFKGLTFCANPDVSSISTATDQEKQQIFGLLSGGVYV